MVVLKNNNNNNSKRYTLCIDPRRCLESAQGHGEKIKRFIYHCCVKNDKFNKLSYDPTSTFYMHLILGPWTYMRLILWKLGAMQCAPRHTSFLDFQKQNDFFILIFIAFAFHQIRTKTVLNNSYHSQLN